MSNAPDTPYRRPRFGIFAPAPYGDLTAIRAVAKTADREGVDFVSIQDHPYAPAMADTLTVIAVLIGETERVGFLTDVANLPLRPPAMLAKAAATLDALSGGRFILGIGAGRQFAEIAALGGPSLDAVRSVDAFEEAIRVIRAMWSDVAFATVDGRHYRLEEAPTGPVPAHGVPVWTGAKGPRMLGLTGREADGWIAPLAQPYEAKAAAQDSIDRAAGAAGRAPTDVRRVLQIVARIEPDARSAGLPGSGPGNQLVAADAKAWREILVRSYEEQRFDTFNLVLARPTPDEVRRFAVDVFAEVRVALGTDQPEGERTGR